MRANLKLGGGVLAMLFLLAAPWATAQEDLQVRPVLQVKNAAQPVRLTSVTVDVSTAASEAWIRYDLVFQNPNARVLEGNLDFPLSDGQQVVGFALDVNGEMRDAVAVPKAKGRTVFEAIERRNVDPALLEKTAGNHYSLRIYPIPANGTRTVRLWVAQSLKRVDKTYQLPLTISFAREVKSIPLSVTGNERAVLANFGRRLNWSAQDKRTSTVLDARDLDRAGRVVLEWPATDAPTVLLQRAPQGDFALAELKLVNATSAKAPIRHLALIWDASLSGLERDHDLELAALSRLLNKLSNVRVTLQLLRDTSSAPRVFDIKNGQSAQLLSVLREQPYDGATRASAIAPIAGADRYLYVGDGLFNLGVDSVPTLPARLDAWTNGAADSSRLRSWTAAHRGAVVALNSTADLPAVDDMLRTPAMVERIDVPGGKGAVVETPFVDAEGRIRFAVERQSANARATVHWRDARGAHATVVPLVGELTEGRMAAYTWARWTMDALEADRASHSSELQALGARFGIPNAESSLIVLETADDYARYDIQPLADLLAEWQRIKQLQREALVSKRQAQVDALNTRYEERGKWWTTVFPKDAPPTAKPTPAVAEARAVAALDAVEVQGQQRAMARSTRAAEAAAASAPPPSPVALMAPGTVSANSTAGVVAGAASIRIQAWRSDSPEALRLRSAPKAMLYATYLDARQSLQKSPAFYMDAADVLRDRGEVVLAKRVLSNLAELAIEDRHLLRLLAYRMQELKAWKEAVPLLRRVLELAPDEPQSYRDLALALQATHDYQGAADAFYTVVTGTWDSRFADIDLISLVELNTLINKHAARIDTSRFDARLLHHYPVGLRTVLSWDANNSDMDLWVTDPNGERVYYAHKTSYQGGRISRDFTGGYGPEEFVLRLPKKGVYKVEANYFGDRQQVLAGETTLMLTFSTDYGTPAQKDQTVTLRLKDKKETIAVGTFEVK